MGRPMLLRDVHTVSANIDTKEVKYYFEQAARRGWRMSDFIRNACERYSKWLDEQEDLPPVDSKITLSNGDGDSIGIQTPDPQPEPTPILDILNYKK